MKSNRVPETKITVYKDEAYSASVTVLDAAGAAVNLSTLGDLVFLIEDQYGTDVLSIPDGSINVSGASSNIFTVQLTTAVSQVVGRPLFWSLRVVSSDLVVAHGTVETLYAAT